MTMDRVQLVWDRGCAATAQTETDGGLEIGPDGKWTADRLLMAAAESAVMTSFLALAEEQALEVLGYVSSARVEQGPRLAYRIIVRPCIVVARDTDIDRAKGLFAHAFERSAVATALAAILRIDAEVIVLGRS
jgi:hypothetical protein